MSKKTVENSFFGLQVADSTGTFSPRVEAFLVERCEKRGVSLLEVLLSTLLFAFVIGGAAAVWRFHELSFQKTRNRNSAHHILKQELDRITSYPYVHLEEAERDFTLSVTRYVDAVAVDQQFQVTSTITENSQESMKSIALEVTYTERNETRSIAAETKAFRSQ